MHILASPGYAPGTIAVNVTWMKRGFNACQKHRSMYPSIFNRLRAIARYWLEIATFSYPLSFNAPVRGDPLGRSLWFLVWMSCRMARLQYGAKISPKKLNPQSSGAPWAAPGGGKGGSSPPCPRPAPSCPPSLAERVCGAPWWNELNPMHLAL